MMSIGKRVRIMKRGYILLNRFCPGLVFGKTMGELTNALVPYVSIFFSARLIDELCSARRIKYAALYAGSLVLANFALMLLGSVIHRVCDEREGAMWVWFHKVFSDKQAAVDYVDIESAEMQMFRRQNEENLFMYGNGLPQLVWGIPELVRALTDLILAPAMLLMLFFSSTGRFIIDRILLIPVICALLAAGIINYRATLRENKIFEKWCEGNVWFNRLFSFFSDELGMESARARDIRIYEQHRSAQRELDRMIEKEKNNSTGISEMVLPSGISGIVIGFANMFCYLYVALKAFFGAFGVGSIVQYAGALIRLGEGFRRITYVLSDNEVYCEHLKKLYEYLDHKGDMEYGSKIPDIANCDEIIVEFRNVSFKYPGTDKYALRSLSLKIRRGEHLAVVGMNGSGKTTFIKLLCRLYDPDEGEILFNGVDIREYDREEYLKLFSVVFQDSKLFALPLGENIAASDDYDTQRVCECLKKAGFADRLNTIAHGLDTPLYHEVSSNGVELSGGEAQKAVLARAIYRDTDFMILDEPTAALDPVSEYEMYSRFAELAHDKTAIYISHRLASCRFCERIIVFEKGKIVETGSHDVLLDSCGKYHELWQAQAKYYRRS